MAAPTTLLHLLSQAVLTALDESAVDSPAVQAGAETAEVVWTTWQKQADAGRLREEVQALARASAPEIEEAVNQIVAQLARDRPPRAVDALRAYLVNVPALVRCRLRRPAEPSGTTLPSWLVLQQASDLLPLLPPRCPWFERGDRPWELGGWELVELLDLAGFGETWQARSTRTPAEPPAALKFLLHPDARQRLGQRGPQSCAAVLERVQRQAQHPGILSLRRLYLGANPPCLEYELVESGDLDGLIREWHASGNSPAPRLAGGVILQVARALGHIHRLGPPLVHRGLRPASILVRQEADGALVCKVADLGLGDLLRSTQSGGDAAQRYASPGQRRGDLPDPRDDVYALGVLWYQLVTGALETGRPGGSQWRRRLAEGGMPVTLIELLEACFEDDPQYRPADAGVLADRLAPFVEEQAGRPAPPARARSGLRAEVLFAEEKRAAPEGAPSRGRGRRADVLQIFESLEKKGPELAKTLSNTIGLKLVLIPAGTFRMGAPPDEAGRRENEDPWHEVTLTRPFYLGVYPVTQGQYERVMQQNPSRHTPAAGGGPDHPVENVTWLDAAEFCRRLSELAAEQEAGRAYRLPTEAEWEHACRAGTTTAFCFGPALSSAQANFDGRFPSAGADVGRFAGKTTKGGAYPPNNFGLCDMHGNVWEWCADWLDSLYYGKSPRRDPPGPAEGRFRVLRGGSWRNHAVTCRAAYRNGLAPGVRDGAVGFRVVLEATGSV
jgi:formylglycine-generating enzyme required for sulfatase activity